MMNEKDLPFSRIVQLHKDDIRKIYPYQYRNHLQSGSYTYLLQYVLSLIRRKEKIYVSIRRKRCNYFNDNARICEIPTFTAQLITKYLMAHTLLTASSITIFFCSSNDL